SLFPREDRQWQALCEAMGRPGLASESRFADFASRKANRLELNEILRTWTRDLPMERIYHEAAGRGCPAAPYHTAADLATSEQLEARRFFTELDHPVAGRLQYPTAAYGMSATKPVYRSAAPLLGEHNEEIFRGRLGLSPRELADLGRSGVL
ncbi:MAG: CoA transferase, partial [Chloroflexi bacterium]|nr:CoA transferase [Chloroflexota bacterium]